MAEPARIGLVLDKRISYWRRVMLGVLQYARPAKDWTFHTVRPDETPGGRWLAVWAPAGVIGDLHTPQWRAELRELGCPLVNVGNAPTTRSLPGVSIDHERVGEQAAIHLLERGLQHFAYFSYRQDPLSRLQEAGYARVLRRAARRYARFDWSGVRPMPRESGWKRAEKAITRWILDLPKPVGMMLFDDDCGLWLTQICRHVDVKVPDEVALVGVNDDPLDCQMSSPPLSSVALPLEQMGYRAAMLLERLMVGGRVTDKATTLAPLRVVARQSSDIVAVADGDLSAAVRFIHDHADQPLRVADVLRQIPVSRRVLEQKFRRQLGRSPLQEIRRAHLQRAQHLLANTTLPLSVVAQRSGHGRPEHLCATFRRRLGITPMKYRRRFSLSG